ncbi:DNA polymerase ligase N-terminal domain-containing protein [Candidatus Omnitrophota bacterium]
MPERSRDPIFVIQKHRARNLHYDFRLEKDGALKSWAIPKEPPAEEGVRRLALRVEDHELDYAGFEGDIPEGSYGAGHVEIWDKGSYEPVKSSDSELVFDLKGKRLKGAYCLIKLKPKMPKDKSWLFFKKKKK